MCIALMNMLKTYVCYCMEGIKNKALSDYFMQLKLMYLKSSPTLILLEAALKIVFKSQL